jgi:hypothetical protein
MYNIPSLNVLFPLSDHQPLSRVVLVYSRRSYVAIERFIIFTLHHLVVLDGFKVLSLRTMRFQKKKKKIKKNTTMDIFDIDALKIILLEEEDDEILLWYLSGKKRKEHNPLFTNRSTEVYREILINGHINNNEIKFRECFRINRDQLNFILYVIRDDLTLNSMFFVRDPMSDEKLDRDSHS